MNIFIAAVYGYNSYCRGIMPDVLQTQIDDNPGANIYYLTNSGSFDISYFNIQKKPGISYLSKTGVKNTLKHIRGNFVHLKIEEITLPQDYTWAKRFFKEEKTITFPQKFEDFEIGEATLSTYISCTRDKDLLQVNRPFVRELAINGLALYLATKRFLKEKKIDVVYNFNGRQEYVRAIMRAALANKINCYNLERARMGGYIEFYKNVLPHNIQTKKQKVESCWETSTLTEEEKTAIAGEFFRRQKSGESVIFPSYLKKQTKKALPEGIFNGNKHVVLFNSSEDEFAALGEEFKNPLFPNQNEGIFYLVELFGEKFPQLNFIVRMHPNLSGVDFNYVREIRDLHQKYPNIFIVPPESETDSYALIELADKVLSFGSTTGLEANFHEKPVILLGKCYYYYSEVAYLPKSKKDIPQLIAKDLKPSPKINSLKFGFFFLKGGVKARYYYEKEMGNGIYFKGKRIFSYTFLQRFKAKAIQKSYQFFGMRLKF